MGSLLNRNDVKALAGEILGVVKEAKRIFEGSDFTVEKKADGSPVTTIDTAVQAQLKTICQKYLGDSIHFVAEETSSEEVLTSAEGKQWWVFIDPIDGTTPLCAGDPGNACIAVGIFLDGKPYMGFVGKLGDQSLVYGGVGTGQIVRLRSDGFPWQRKNISRSNQMCCIDLASGPAADPVMSQFILSVVADRTLGGYPYNVPSIASALKLIEGHAKFFIGSNSKPWDVAAVMPMLLQLGYTFQSLETGRAIVLDGTRTAIAAFVMSTSGDYAARLIERYGQIKAR